MANLSWAKKSAYSAFVFFGTLMVLTIGYAAWNAAMAPVNTGDSLSASKWNAFVDNINDLDSRWSRNGLAIGYIGGNVGIGTTSPSAGVLDVRGDTGAGWVGSFTSTNATNNGRVLLGSRAASAGSVQGTTNAGAVASLLLNPDGGAVGIGTASPTTKLHVAGTIKIDGPEGIQSLLMRNASHGGEWSFRLQGDGATTNNFNIDYSIGTPVNLFMLRSSGNATLAGTLTQNSDIRLKKDITPIENPLEKISKLNGVTYFWKDASKSPDRQIGVIAQDVEKVFPEAVVTDENGTKSVAYGNLIAPLVEAIKELSHKIDELFTKYLDQQKKIDSLESRIEKLEQK